MEKHGRKDQKASGFSIGAGTSIVPGLVASPSDKIVKYRLYNKIPEKQRLIDFFGADMIPDWLFPPDPTSDNFKQVWPHTQFYRDKFPADPTSPQYTDNWTAPQRYLWKPLDIANGLEDYRIYYTMVNRMDYFERLIAHRYSDPNRQFDQKYIAMEQTARAAQDWYIQLALHMMMKNQFTDTELVARRPISALDMYGPHLKLSFTVEEIPDFSIVINNCRFWGDEVDSPFTMDSDGHIDPEMTALIAAENKFIPHSCNRRSVITTVLKAWIKYGHINVYRCYLRIVIASLLGVYEHCAQIANFSARLKIYKWFIMMSPSPFQFAEWMSSNKFLTIYAVREHMFWTVKHLHALYDFLSERYYYRSVVYNINKSMDKVRKRFNRYVVDSRDCLPRMDDMGNSLDDFFRKEQCHSEFDVFVASQKKLQPGKAWFDWAEHFLDRSNKKNPDSWPRVMAESFTKKMVRTFAEYEIAYICSGRVSREDISKKSKILEACFERIAKDSDYNDYHALSLDPFKVSELSVCDIEMAETLYERETSRSEVGKAVAKLLTRGVEDFLIFQHFFKIKYAREVVSVYPLPLDWTKLQVEKFHELYNTRIGDALPPSAGLYYVCTSCGNIRSVTIEYNSGNNLTEKQLKRREKMKKSSLCCDGIQIDVTTGRKYCLPSKSKAGAKKRGATPSISKYVNVSGGNSDVSALQQFEDEEGVDDNDDDREEIVELIPDDQISELPTLDDLLGIDDDDDDNDDEDEDDNPENFSSDEDDDDNKRNKEGDEDDDSESDNESSDDDDDEDSTDDEKQSSVKKTQHYKKSKPSKKKNTRPKRNVKFDSSTLTTPTVSTESMQNTMETTTASDASISTTKKIEKDVTVLRSKEREAKNRAKHLRQKSLIAECSITELWPVNMIGQLLVLEKHIVVLCPHCLAVTRFSRYNFSGLGGEFSCGCKKVKEAPIRCTLCFKKTTEETRLFFFVFDDERDSPCVRKMPFCNSSECKWIKGWTQTFLKLSIIKKSYKENWYTSKMGTTGERFFRTREMGRPNLYSEMNHNMRQWKRDQRAEEIENETLKKPDETIPATTIDSSQQQQ